MNSDEAAKMTLRHKMKIVAFMFYIDLINILQKTKYGSDGMGGIITKGTMYVGYPRE